MPAVRLPSVRLPFVLALVLGSMFTGAAPATGPDPDPMHQLQVVAAEIDAIEDLALGVWDPTLRRELFTHVRNAETALHRAKYEMEYGGWDSSGRPGYGRPATISYADARTVVMREQFDSGRVSAIEKVAKNGRFTTEEAAGLAGMCTFDSYKRQALIALYPSVVDPARYMLALDILDFDSSRRDVEQALGL